MDSLYDRFMYSFEKGKLGLKRAELIPLAYGRVLEIGAGTGVNLQYYDFKQIDHIVLSDKLYNPVLHRKLKSLDIDYRHHNFDVEDIPYGDRCFDTIVVTLVFCSVKSVKHGLNELRRVLKDGGQILFIEHVLPEKKPLQALFDFFTPLWKHMASNCHLNRDFLQSLTEAGFKVEKVSRFNKTAFVSGRAIKL